MDKRYYNVSSVRVARFLYSLGFDKESYISKSGKEKWRFEYSDDLIESIDFYKNMRKRRCRTYGERDKEFKEMGQMDGRESP